MAEKTLILFDMDGTILDTLDDLCDSVNVILREKGYPERSREEIRRFVGNGARVLIDRAMPEESSEAEREEALERYKAYYEAHCEIKTKPYDGVAALMRTLRSEGKKVAVISNKPDAAVRKLCASQFPGCVDAAVGDTPERRRKPAPDNVFAAIERLGGRKEDAVYVGDSEVDAETARAAGIPLVAVSWGFRDREELLRAGAETIADTAEELMRKLRDTE